MNEQTKRKRKKITPPAASAKPNGTVEMDAKYAPTMTRKEEYEIRKQQANNWPVLQ